MGRRAHTTAHPGSSSSFSSSSSSSSPPSSSALLEGQLPEQGDVLTVLLTLHAAVGLDWRLW